MVPKEDISIAQTLASCFLRARARQQGVVSQWNKVSWHLGPRLGDSLLVLTIQQQGETDSVLRCVEDELADPERRKKIDFVTTPYWTMSAYWIGAIYEVLRLLRERKLMSEPEAEPIFKDFELLRIPLEKHEIAKDRNFAEPVRMSRVPLNEEGDDYYTYDPRSPERAHIMPSGLSQRGSLTWQVIESTNHSSRWIERRSLSDRILNLWGAEREA
jgi:hypothetical protein